jgi:hypothetical protein
LFGREECGLNFRVGGVWCCHVIGLAVKSRNQSGKPAEPPFSSVKRSKSRFLESKSLGQKTKSPPLKTKPTAGKTESRKIRSRVFFLFS